MNGGYKAIQIEGHAPTHDSMSPGLPSSEKIVFTRRTRRHAQCVKVDWPESDNTITWASIFYWLGGTDIWDSIVSGISSNCIPPGSIVYTKLNPRHLDRTTPQDSLIALDHFVQMSRDQIVKIYQRLWDVTIGCQRFFVCKDPLPDLKRALSPGRFSSKMRKQLLDHVYLILFNHYDHGFEIIGRSISPDPLLEVAREVSTYYDLPLEVQETGDPFGEIQTR